MRCSQLLLSSHFEKFTNLSASAISKVEMLSFVILAMALGAISAAYDSDFYCTNQEKFCDGKQNHIGCGDADWGMNCGDEREVVTMTQEFQDLIVNTHNKYRSQIATGKIKDGDFGTATRMASLKWDANLAFLAERNARKCRQRHSLCANTPEYKMVGECNGLQDAGKKYPNKVQVMKQFMRAWFLEYKDADAGDIKSTPLNYGIAHFLTMACDRQVALGCALTEFQGPNGNRHSYFNCAYSTMSMTEHRVYIQGEPASRCTTGENPDFPGLCSVDEVVDPNEFYRKRTRGVQSA